MTGSTVGEVGDVLAGLRELAGRLARFEDVPQAELDAFHAAKHDILGRIDKGALL